MERKRQRQWQRERGGGEGEPLCGRGQLKKFTPKIRRQRAGKFLGEINFELTQSEECKSKRRKKLRARTESEKKGEREVTKHFNELISRRKLS